MFYIQLGVGGGGGGGGVTAKLTLRIFLGWKRLAKIRDSEKTKGGYSDGDTRTEPELGFF